MSIINTIKKKIPIGNEPKPVTDVTKEELTPENTDNTNGENNEDNQNNNTGEAEEGNSESTSNSTRGPNEQESQSGGNQSSNNTEQEGQEGQQHNQSSNTNQTPENQTSITDFGKNSAESDDNEAGDDNEGEQNNQGDGEKQNEQNSEEEQQQNGQGDGEEKSNDSQSDDGNETNNSPQENGEETEQDGQDDGLSGDPDEDITNPEDEEEFSPDEDVLEQERNQIEREKEEQELKKQRAEQALEQFKQGMETNTSSDSAAGGELSPIQVNSYPSAEADSDRWKQARQGYRDIAGLLRKKLKKARKDKRIRAKRSGTPDSTRLHALQSKQLDVMEQRKQGDKKQYAVIIVLDRSGSMGGQRIDLAERALIKYALALEDLSIDVCVIDMYRNTPRVISPFTISIENSKGDILTRETRGGTPLRKVIPIARRRMLNSGKVPIMVTITDGYPDKKEKYLQELEKCRMPVMGITVRPGMSSSPDGTNNHGQEKYYDAHKFATSIDELLTQLEDLTLELPIQA